MLTTLIAVMAMAPQDRPQNIEKFMTTRWTQAAAEGRTWTEYPRPQLVRDKWMNLNGKWNYAIAPKGALEILSSPKDLINVPFAIQSHLSGVQKQVYADQELHYSRTFTLPEDWNGSDVLLNFGAVDWQCWVSINGQPVGEHTGGYDPFSFSIGKFLKPGENSIEVKVWDPTTDGDQPYGKQTFTPGGIWYTAVTGIWQTVWLEPVPKTHVASIRAETKINGQVEIIPELANADHFQHMIAIVSLNGKEQVRGQYIRGQKLVLNVPDPQLWSPSSPTLYDLEFITLEDGAIVDRVQSYFGIREIALKEDEYGTRTYLNGKPIFMFGPLDQGWWPDGLYTPPSDDALRYDIDVLKRAGFNTIRKHIKLEPARFYRHCDEIGMLVWQDMPSNLNYPPGWNTNWRVKNPKPDGPRPEESKRNFESEWQRIIDASRMFPSIVVWVPFNEAWGQFDTVRINNWTKQHDPTRLVNGASGGNFTESGDLFDIHVYPGPGSPDPQPGRAIVLGEFGGLGLPLAGHTWQAKDNWGYQSFPDSPALMVRYEELIKNLVLAKSKGLSAAIYTQTTDVEIETNGLMTYDREVIKMPLDWLRRVNLRAYGPPIQMTTILATADEEASEWAYMEAEPPAGWEQPDFKDSSWKKGKAGFGTAETPGSVVGTIWKSNQIWLRRTFTGKSTSGDIWLKIHHDEDADVYLNGNLIAKLSGYVGDYQYVDIADGAIREGLNTLAVHCKQTAGGQFIDVGISQATPR
jgi:hypothetical protein